jgi:cell division protein FtsQ
VARKKATFPSKASRKGTTAVGGVGEDPACGEMESSSETPYMRRSRAVAVRQGRIPQGIRRVAWWAGIIVCIFLPLAFGGYSLISYLLSSPRFKLASPRDVAVKGNHYVSQEQVLAALGVQGDVPRTGSDIFSMSLKESETQVEAIPWVQSATVVRSYPHDLTIYVKERVPVAFVDVNDQIRMVDQYGILLDAPEKSHFDFPIVKGLDFQGTAADRSSRLSLFQEFMRETKSKISGSGWIVSEVDLSDPGNLEALLVQGGQTLLVYFGHADFLGRFENLLTVLPQLRKTNATVDSVDLRYRDQVVVNPADENSGKAHADAPTAAKKTRGN